MNEASRKADPAAKTVLFISHNAADRPYAEALRQVIDDLLDNRSPIDVRISTNEKSGPEGGEAWREWIYRTVVEARTTLIIVTPHAMGKPWLLWEAGAVRGAELARDRAADSPSASIIVSLAYGLPISECPDPLRGEQIIQGTDIARLEELFIRILQAHGIADRTLYEAGKRTDVAFKRYLPAIEAAMQRAPSLNTEANVQDWLKRLDDLSAGKRLSELRGFERWMMLAFGRDIEEDTRSGGIPIDVRLHRTLGELYLSQKQYLQAVRQLRLAWRAAPRDIFVLRPLAEASMKCVLQDGAVKGPGDPGEIKLLLAAIRELDDGAYTESPDSAGLFGKYHRRVLGQPDKALDIYEKALKVNPRSYYLAGLVGQTALELEKLETARASFERVLEIITGLGEKNIWSHASAATAYVGLARVDEAREQLVQVREVGPPSASEAESIAGGIREVAARAKIPAEVVKELLVALTPQGGT